MTSQNPQIKLEVYRTTANGERELSIYSLPGDVHTVIVDGDELHGSLVVGSVDRGLSKDTHEIEGNLLWRGDGTLMA